MGEPKRVSFTTLSSVAPSMGTAVGGMGPVSVTSAASLRFGSDFAMGPAAEKPASNGAASGSKSSAAEKTVRLNLELFPSDTASYPEFNFAKLMRLEKKKLKKLKQRTNGISDPFEDNDDDVARIAKELEAKYGSAYGSGRSGKKDDQCDIGMGYDESDSFIDNTEAYDEIVPEEVETIEGGFYINCGPLEYKKLHGESTTTKTDEIIKMPNRPKKRILSSSSEEESSSEKDEGDEANCDDDDDEDDDDDDSESDNETEEKSAPESGKEAAGYKGQPPEKRKKVDAAGLPGAAAANGLLKAKPPQDSQHKKKDKPQGGLTTTSSSSNSPKVHLEEVHGSDSEKERKNIKTTTVKDMLKAKRDNFLKMQGSGANGGAASGSGKASKSSDEDDSSSDDDDDDSDDSNSNEEQRPTDDRPAQMQEKIDHCKLPFELKPDNLTRITQFSEHMLSKNMFGKKFQLEGESMELFVKIEESLTEKSVRTKVFSHLEYRFQLPKYYFLRKAKQLRAKNAKLKLQRATAKLRSAVMESMPNATAAYELEMQRYAEMQQDKVNDDKPPKLPKKKFPWTASLKQLLYEVYVVCKQSYSTLGTRKDTVVEFINAYLRDKVLEIWPVGWMRLEELQREIEKYIMNDQQSNGGALSNVDDLDPILIAHSDTDSRASSASGTGPTITNAAASSGATDVKPPKAAKPRKPAKSKAEKKQRQDSAMPPMNSLPPSHAIEVVDLVSPTRRPDLSPTPYMPGMDANASALMQKLQQQITQHQQQLLKHSKGNEAVAMGGPSPNIAVIDLDKLTSASDILETTKMMNAMTASKNLQHHQQQQQQQLQQQQQQLQQQSQSDSLEFISIYPAPGAQQRPVAPSMPNSSGSGKGKSKKNDLAKQAKAAAAAAAAANFAPHLGAMQANLYPGNNNNAIRMDNTMAKAQCHPQYQQQQQHTNLPSKSPKTMAAGQQQMGGVSKDAAQ